MQSGMISGVLIRERVVHMYSGKTTKKRSLITLCIVLTLMMSILGAASLSVVFAEDGDNNVGNESKAKRTIMIYLDGASSEANNPVCSAMIKEYVNAKFNRDDLRIIVMTGGSSKWHLDSKYLRDRDGNSGTLSEISNEYNQIWEVYGATNDAEGYIKLLDADGVSGDGEGARKSAVELMKNPDTLKGFINFAKNYAPAEKYCLILNDHGNGPGRGYGLDDHDTANPNGMMSVAGLKQAISESDVVKNGGKFDFIDLDCCMMGNFEMPLALSDYIETI